MELVRSNKFKLTAFIGLMLFSLMAAVRSRVLHTARKKRKGAFAFEYIIVLVLMVSVIIAGWTILGDMVVKKANEIANSVNGVNVNGWNIGG